MTERCSSCGRRRRRRSISAWEMIGRVFQAMLLCLVFGAVFAAGYSPSWPGTIAAVFIASTLVPAVIAMDRMMQEQRP